MVTQQENQVHDLQEHVHDLEHRLADMASYHQDTSEERDQLADELVFCQGSLEDIKRESALWRGHYDVAKQQAESINQRMVSRTSDVNSNVVNFCVNVSCVQVDTDKIYVNRMEDWQNRANKAENMLAKWQCVADGSEWNWQCPICMNALGCVRVNCCKSANLCAECFDRIAESGGGCPFCRQDIGASTL